MFVNGQGPSARYAHTLALVANRFIVAMGGNDGRNTLSDAWSLDTSEKPYQWRKVSAHGSNPPARYAAVSFVCSADELIAECSVAVGVVHPWQVFAYERTILLACSFIPSFFPICVIVSELRTLSVLSTLPTVARVDSGQP